jgi:hypothetical protein
MGTSLLPDKMKRNGIVSLNVREWWITLRVHAEDIKMPVLTVNMTGT